MSSEIAPLDEIGRVEALLARLGLSQGPRSPPPPDGLILPRVHGFSVSLDSSSSLLSAACPDGVYLPERCFLGFDLDEMLQGPSEGSGAAAGSRTSCSDWESGNRGPSIEGDDGGQGQGRRGVVLSELGDFSVGHLRSVAARNLSTAMPCRMLLHPLLCLIPVRDLLKDLASLLMGLESDSFRFATSKKPRNHVGGRDDDDGDDGRFVVRPGLAAEGTTPEAIESFAQDFLVCGSIVRALDRRASTPKTDLGDAGLPSTTMTYSGFVAGIKQYLRLHRRAAAHALAASPPAGENSPGRRLDLQLVRKLAICARFIAKVANLGSGQDRGRGTAGSSRFDVPDGLDLVLYVLNKTMHVTNPECEAVAVVLVRSTVAPYLRFLSSWLFTGLENARGALEEFDIETDHRFLDVRTREFWQRAFRNKTGADRPTSGLAAGTTFAGLEVGALTDMVVRCGKAVNLLRICVPNHLFWIPASSSFRPDLTVAISPLQERQLRDRCRLYASQVGTLLEELHLVKEVAAARSGNSKRSSAANKERVRLIVAERQKYLDSHQAAWVAARKEFRDRLLAEGKATKRDLHSAKEVCNVSAAFPLGSESAEDSRRRIEAVRSDLIAHYSRLCGGDLDVVGLAATRVPPPAEEPRADWLERSAKGQQHFEGVDQLLEGSAMEDDVEDKMEDKVVEDQAEAKVEDCQVEVQVEDKVAGAKLDDCLMLTDAEVPAYTAAVNQKGPSNEPGPSPASWDRNELNDAALLTPLHLLVRNSILVPLQAQLSLVNREVLRMMLVWEGLDEAFRAIRNYILLYDSEFAFNLATELHSLLQGGSGRSQLSPALDRLQSPGAFSRCLKNAIGSSSRASADELTSGLVSFSLSSVTRGASEVDESEWAAVLEGPALTFQAKWPLNIILTQECLRFYGQSYRFMVRLELVSVALNDAFLSLMKHRYSLGVNRRFLDLQFARHRMLHSVSTIKSFIRHVVLVKTWNEFRADMEAKVTCLDSLWEVHGDYLNKVVSRTFLKKDARPLRQILLKMLDSAANFARTVSSPDMVLTSVGGGAAPQVRTDLYLKAKAEENTFSHCLNLLISVASKLEHMNYRHNVLDLVWCLKLAASGNGSGRAEGKGEH